MKILNIIGAMPKYDLGIKITSNIINNIFSELNVDVEEINIHNLFLPHFNGNTITAVQNVVEKIKSADGIIFSTTAIMRAPCAITQSLLDHLSLVKKNKLLDNKNCMILTVSADKIETEAGNHLALMINDFNGFDCVRIALNKNITDTLEDNPINKEIFEKQIEDFYRILRQGRKHFVDTTLYEEDINSLKDYTEDEIDEINETELISIEELSEKLNLDNALLEEDIVQISNYFAQKFIKTEEGLIEEEETLVFDAFDKVLEESNITPREKSLKQKTQSLPHYFKINNAIGESFRIQLFVTGEEKFEGYLIVDNNDCQFSEGSFDKPDIVIHTEGSVWDDILTGRKTAQKSFMTGQLKVKGNFLILTKFDQIFEKVS